jgi:aminopeptidase N
MRGASVLLALLWLSAAARADAPPQGRLPEQVTPSAYRLDLNVDPGEPRFSAHAEIDAVLAQPGTVIYLHGNGLRVNSARIRAGQKTYVAHYAQVDPLGVARLDLSRPVSAGPITLYFDYSGELRHTPDGLYRAKVGNDWYAWTQMEAIDARRVFPGFDEPRFKTPFTVTIRAPKGAKVFANAPEIGVIASGSTTVHRFAATKPLPTYLVAIGVGPFEVVETTVPPNAVRHEPLPFRVIAPKGQGPRMGFAAAEGPRLLGMLEGYFGTPYPYEKLDFLASTLQGGAMENAGLIIFADSLILLDPHAPLRQLRAFAEVSAHEMAHQWFGDLVTPTWWTDLWLNESFAQWMGKKIADRWRPDLGIAAEGLDDAFAAMDVDALGAGRPIHQEITRNTEISGAFDAITYNKGAQVLSMFEAYLGSDTFARGVRLHLSRHRHGSATADDFFQALGEAADNPRVVPAMRTFTDQTGVPVVSVGEGAQGVQLAQARYRPLGAEARAAQRWLIPMCLARGATRSCILLETAAQTIAPLGAPGAALMPDAGAAGYYRFRFDGPGWDRLLGEADHLSGPEAMAVADNLWADFAAGGIDFDRVIAGARALAGNPERLAAIKLGYRFKSLSDTMLSEQQRAAYRALMQSLYGPRLAALGSDVTVGAYAADPAPRAALRQSLLQLVALEARDPGLRATLAAAARANLDGDAHALDPAFRTVALQVAAQDGDAAFLIRLKDALQNSSDPLFKHDASIAIGSVDTPALTEAALEIATSHDLESPFAMRIVYLASGHPGSRETTTAYIENHLPRVLGLFPPGWWPSIVRLFDGFCDADAAAKVERFFKPRLKELGGGELQLAKTTEQIRVCAALKSARGSEIAAAFAH